MLQSLVRQLEGPIWPRFRIVVAASVVFSLMGLFLSLAATDLPVEAAIYDAMLRRRNQASQAERPAELVVVAVTDETLSNPRQSQPEIFSPLVWSEILDALVMCGAKAMVVHRTLPTGAGGDSVPAAEEARWLKSVELARRAGLPVVFGLRWMGARPLWPAPKYLENLGRENLGFMNLARDRDGKVRRLLLHQPTRSEQTPDSHVEAWAVLAAKAAAPELASPQPPLFIDYRGAFSIFNFADVHAWARDGQLDLLKRFFSGAVVLFGEANSADLDAYPTPISSFVPGGEGWLLMPAVEIEAHAVMTMLSGRRLLDPGPLALWCLIFGLTLLALAPLLAGPARSVRLTSWLPTAMMAAYPLAAYLAFQRYVYLPVIPGLASLLTAQGLHWIVRWRETKRIQAASSQALNLYLNPDLAGQIVNNPDILQRRGELRTVSVLFADLVGFTSLAETMDTAAMVDLLNRWFDVMNIAVERFGGFVDKFVGDAVMAIWGAPSSQPQHAVSACLSALMQKTLLEQLNRELAAAGQPALQALMGVNTGQVVAGNIGARHRLNYTVMGDAVNLASRLVAVNKLFKTTILACEPTMTLAKKEVAFRTIDRVRVKGRRGGQTIYEVLGPVGGLSAQQAQCVNFFERALRHYWERDFAGALTRFEAALKTMPDDNPSRILAQRCREFINSPPGPEWDGVTVLEAK
ncbi:MAG: CHASE2 domain-containing protein [Deltaproteobacteria bacterium]|jgi:class 3 adenylate cyclase/CHASE2 domain-containing sensor protein|nr:CHASE2 domain-containing protein [Deltaproteobacteria bacterium]